MRTASRTKTKLALLAGDMSLFVLALATGTYLRLGDLDTLLHRYNTAAILCLLIYPLCLYLSQAYEVQPEASSAENLRRPLPGLLVAVSVSSFFFYIVPEISFGRGIFAIANGIYVILLPLWRIWIFARLRRVSLTILLMGNAPAVQTAQKLIREFSPGSQVRVWQPEADVTTPGERFVTHATPAATHDLLVLAGPALEPCMLRKAAELRLQGVSVWNLARLYSEFAERLPAPYLDELWVATADGFRSFHETSSQVIKRLMDISLAFIGLLCFSPLVAVAAIFIKLQDGGSVFYSQDRVGTAGKPFRIHKLRTMVAGAEHLTGPVWASRSDPRVTRVGRLLRRLRIDEIPQMWNVLKGEMSFVGPRPERPVFVEVLQRKYAMYSLRHLVRPGITGWAQVRCPYAACEEDNMRKLEYDLYYVQNASLLFDLRIILHTIGIVSSARGGW